MAFTATMKPVPDEEVSAATARELFLKNEANYDETKFSCPECEVGYDKIALDPTQRFKVSPHFRIPDGEHHIEGCPYAPKTTEEGARIRKLLKNRIPRSDCETIPGELLFPETNRRIKTQDDAREGIIGDSVDSGGQDIRVAPVRGGSAPLRTSVLEGIVTHRNEMWNKLLNSEKTGEKPLEMKAIGKLLSQITLTLPSGPSNYSYAFARLHWPLKKAKIYFEKKARISIAAGIVTIDSGILVRSDCRDFPDKIGKRAIVQVPFDPTKRRHHNIVLCEEYLNKAQLADWFAYGDCTFSEELDQIVLRVGHPAHLVIAEAVTRTQSFETKISKA